MCHDIPQFKAAASVLALCMMYCVLSSDAREAGVASHYTTLYKSFKSSLFVERVTSTSAMLQRVRAATSTETANAVARTSLYKCRAHCVRVVFILHAEGQIKLVRLHGGCCANRDKSAGGIGLNGATRSKIHK